MDSSTTITIQQNKSAKRHAREEKLAKKEAKKRTKEERQVEVYKIMEKIKELGISETMLGKFPAITKDFIEFDISASGIIKIPDIQRDLVYLLSNNRQNQCVSMLKAL